MTLNMGSIDRILRAIAGIALVGWAISGGPLWAWIGVLPLATAGVGWCPGYVPFGFSTRARQR